MEQDRDETVIKAKLMRFYQKHNPEKVADVDAVLNLMRETDMTEYDLFQTLCRKYNIPYDPLEWKQPVIGQGTINGAPVARSGDSTVRSTADSSVRSSAASTVGDAKLKYSAEVDRMQNSDSSGRPSGILHTTPDLKRQLSSSGLSDAPLPSDADRRQKLSRFYQKYNPTKLDDIDKIIELAADSTDAEVFESLCSKYNLQVKAVFKMLGVVPEEDEEASETIVAGGRSFVDPRVQLQQGKDADTEENVLKQEFAEWISFVLKLDPAIDAHSLLPTLSNGVLLCKLIHTLNPNVSFRYSEKPANHFQELANVELFLEHAVRDFGLSKKDKFNPDALVSRKKMEQRQVMSLFLSLAKKAHVDYKAYAPRIVRADIEIDEEDKAPMTVADMKKMMRNQDAAVSEREEQELKRRDAAEREKEKKAEDEVRRAEQEKRMEQQRRFEERQREQEHLENLRKQRKLEEEKAARLEQQRKEDEFRKNQELRERIRQQALARKHEQQAASAYVEDNPVYQYRGEKYISCRRDELDIQVGRVVNKLPRLAASTKMYRLRTGYYLIEYPKRAVFFVRLVRDVVMTRVGGGWMSLDEFLARRMKDYPELLPKFIPNRLQGENDLIVPLHRIATPHFY